MTYLPLVLSSSSSLLSSADQVPSSFFFNGRLTNVKAMYIKKRQLLYYSDEYGDKGENVTIDWVEPNVCNYIGVFCALAPDNKTI
ncbi:hypothetical protein JCGZ_02755 [Jatropha curcas]|uniref:Leucine-rich repeat-containing N-terminal plant-type domain-containing protein n=1 Tax=Jatropha curcas TaxID=180498 RepID=A0A067KXR8_JATCU|nr:hypothetical protein JCGZ_02753 [Jatropha curcas]KDP39735.1 hypothetical protein JCGZ_02755 [Jatropha curcas]